MCVQDVDVQCVLQFTLLHAAGCALHRHASRVIHRLELFNSRSFVRFLETGGSRFRARPLRCIDRIAKSEKNGTSGRPTRLGDRDGPVL